MGYTQYWNRPRSFDLVAFRCVVQDARRIIEHATQELDLQICSGDGTGSPVLNDMIIDLNGHEDMQAGALVIERDFDPANALEQVSSTLWRDHCKTERKPYDTVVMAILLTLAYHCPGVTIFSDVSASDWGAGVHLYEHVTGRALACCPWHVPPED